MSESGFCRVIITQMGVSDQPGAKFHKYSTTSFLYSRY